MGPTSPVLPVASTTLVCPHEVLELIRVTPLQIRKQQMSRYRSKPDWFTWRLTLLVLAAVLSFLFFGLVGLVSGGDYDRRISGLMLILGLAGAALLWRYFRKPVRYPDADR